MKTEFLFPVFEIKTGYFECVIDNQEKLEQFLRVHITDTGDPFKRLQRMPQGKGAASRSKDEPPLFGYKTYSDQIGTFGAWLSEQGKLDAFQKVFDAVAQEVETATGKRLHLED